MNRLAVWLLARASSRQFVDRIPEAKGGLEVVRTLFETMQGILPSTWCLAAGCTLKFYAALGGLPGPQLQQVDGILLHRRSLRGSWRRAQRLAEKSIGHFDLDMWLWLKKPLPKWVALVSGNMDQNLRFAPPVSF